MPVARYIPALSLCLALIAFVLGVYGFAIIHPERNWDTQVINTWRLYLLDYEFSSDSDELHWALVIARLLAPASLLLGTAWALLCAIGDTGNRILLKFATGHVVIAGSGLLVARLFRDAVALGKRVVVIVPTIDEAKSERLGKRRVAFVVGEIDDPRTLERAKVNRAKHLICFADDDVTNAHSAIHAIGLPKSKWWSPDTLHCHAHIVDHRLRAAFNDNASFKNSTDRAEVYLFSLFEATARNALIDHPLEHDESKSLVASPELVLLGNGAEALPFFLHAARMAHFAKPAKLRVTWFAADADELKISIAHLFPYYTEVVDCEFVPVLTRAPESYAIALVEHAAPKTDTFSTVVCALESDSQNFILAQHLQTAIGDRQSCRILVHVTEDPDLAALVETLEGADTPKTFAIGQADKVGSWNAITKSDLEPTARAIHTHYIEGEIARLGGDAVDNPSLVAWEKLSELKRDQNRFQGDHLKVKLRAIGLDPDIRHDSPELAPALKKHRDLLAEMEHRRWNAAHWLAGFRYGEVRNDGLKIHPSLVPWDQLDEKEQSKDYETIDAIPAILKRSQTEQS